MSKKNKIFIASTLALVLFGLMVPVYAETDQELVQDVVENYVSMQEETANFGGLTPEQEDVLKNMSDLEDMYRKYGENADVKMDIKGSPFRARIGSWSWRDGIICVTDDGLGSKAINTWHAGIIAPQRNYSVAEAPGKGESIRLKHGEWIKPNHTVWQVAVEATSIQQDWNAGHWAGQQVGKPYNTNFWNARQTNSFYCSQLVWAAYYYTVGVDLNKWHNDVPGKIAIHPGEFVNNPGVTTIIYRNR